MQVLELLRRDLPRAAAKDWEQLLCGLRRGHAFVPVGTTYDSIKTGPGRWDFALGQPISRHYRCKLCDKSRVVRMKLQPRGEM